MIFGFHRRQVINNIKKNVAKKQFDAKAELHDPVLNNKETNKIVSKYWQYTKTISYRLFNPLVRAVFNIASQILTGRCSIDGIENLPDSPTAFITGNHYNQFDVLLIGKLVLKKRQRLFIVVEASNLAMPHLIGWAVRNFNLLPIDHDFHYLSRIFPKKLAKVLSKPSWILIYPEEELWFNYRKPRPLKKGAYYYAAKFNQPIISTFTEIQATSKRELFQRDFYKTKKILHILPTIYPNPDLKIRENMQRMAEIDYRQKKAAYEKYYHRKLTIDFSYEDIAGFSPQNHSFNKKIDDS
ncbi:lysophospholipid acyltransferase family protein [Lactobacillus ultunensis]|uniref:Acyltransferase n=1 Tax=Lactobacillus ultunensis DSM 16047 TaxID=525365 RepID=C2EN25_9LACO|nr:1-acyl-sn-glycerol-3-phosphate acyltransferase [Lactobacillus ultunensis]EEJ72067.1 Acyltransferase [Lactobacillus ultunensis DSM 16047]KRL82144.1 phospho-beta-glycosidase [Lactobacillus ultunensis DSM 16047]QQP29599.1 1-acyl-sn-glycerol-3-phosphate acyltransferase [Lactobacillus ultunensis]